MAEDKSVVKQIEAPPLAPFALKPRLAPTPRRAPKYFVKVKNASRAEVILLSNGPLGSALAQSQGLAIADKVARRDRVTICTVSDGAAMEGEAKEAFAAIAGLAAKGRVNPYLLVISDNDTKLSGRITKDAFSMELTFAAMGALGWNVITVANGHDLQAVFPAVERGIAAAMADPTKPVCLLAKTIKGYGIKDTEANATGGHGFPLANGEKIV